MAEDYESLRSALLVGQRAEVASEVGPFFVDRSVEMDELAYAVFRLNEPVTLIVGARGTGKTTLARKFKESMSQQFPGGCLYQHGSPFERDLKGTLLTMLPDSMRKQLVIVDDLDVLERASVPAWFQELHAARPQLQILGISQRAIQMDPIVPRVISIGGMNVSETQSLIHIFGQSVNLDQERLRFLHHASDGNPRVVLTILRTLSERPRADISDILTELSAFAQSGLIGRNGQPLTTDTADLSTVTDSVRTISDEFLARIALNPQLLHQMSPRGFEELIAEVLHRQGCEVELTPISRDGGFDIYALVRTSFGRFLCLVECKRYAPERRVGVQLVRQLWGVVQASRASAGILATTSTFTARAREMERNLTYQLTLHDYMNIHRMVRNLTRVD